MSKISYTPGEAIEKAKRIVANPEVMLSHAQTVALLEALLKAVNNRPHLNPAAAWPFTPDRNKV